MFKKIKTVGRRNFDIEIWFDDEDRLIKLIPRNPNGAVLTSREIEEFIKTINELIR